MPPRYRLCPRCKYRYERIKKKCPSCAAKAPKKRVPRHAQTLRDDNYERYCELNQAIHGVTDESCGVCGRPRAKERRHDRDHDHITGLPRGLACVSCNRLMVHRLTLEKARQIVAYYERVQRYYTKPEDKSGEEPEEADSR